MELGIEPNIGSTGYGGGCAMKFFHISDLHIGLKLVNRDLREDQEYILRQIVQAAKREQPDAVVIAGDLYDTNRRLLPKRWKCSEILLRT